MAIEFLTVEQRRPMVTLMANRQLINWRATFTSMISIGRLLRSTAEITIV